MIFFFVSGDLSSSNIPLVLSFSHHSSVCLVIALPGLCWRLCCVLSHTSFGSGLRFLCLICSYRSQQVPWETYLNVFGIRRVYSLFPFSMIPLCYFLLYYLSPVRVPAGFLSFVIISHAYVAFTLLGMSSWWKTDVHSGPTTYQLLQQLRLFF